MIRPEVTTILDRLVIQLKANYGDHLEKVILFGSQARGEASETSDIDVLILLADEEAPFLEYRNWGDWVIDTILEFGELVNLVFTSSERYDSVHTPLYNNIRNDGILIYDRRSEMAPGKS